MAKENEDHMRKLLDLIRGFAIFLCLLNIYWFCYSSFRKFGLSRSWADQILMNLNNSGIFNSIFYSKLLAFFFVALYCVGEKGKKEENINVNNMLAVLVTGVLMFFINPVILYAPVPVLTAHLIYVVTTFVSIVLVMHGGLKLKRSLEINGGRKDIFNKENETFPQEERLISNSDSVNLRTSYNFAGKERSGWINVVNPYRATAVLGTPGSGKSFAVINEFIRQHLSKGFTMYCYDFKYPDLSVIVYKNLLKNAHKHSVQPKFYVINFDDPSRSCRCNPLLPELMTDMMDAYESSYTIMCNLNRSWIKKQGDFFVESPINFVAACMWFLRLYDNGKYCTFPHLIEFISLEYEQIFPILGAYAEIENFVKPFVKAYLNGAMEQLEGQIASARIPLGRLASKQLYWVMTGNDFSLDLNDPQNPKVLCVGNNPDRQAVYGAALGLYNSRIVKVVNKKNKQKLSIIIDELPTIFFKGLDNLIATARSNKVSTLLGFQDYSQLRRDYGREEADVIINTIGNVFSGMVTGETAKGLSDRFGRSVQERKSHTITEQSTQVSISSQQDVMIPASKISTLTQGSFVGAVADNFGEEIDLKVFHAKINVDMGAVDYEKNLNREIPVFYNFTDRNGVDHTESVLDKNFLKVKQDVKDIAKKEIARIANDENLCHLIIS